MPMLATLIRELEQMGVHAAVIGDLRRRLYLDAPRVPTEEHVDGPLREGGWRSRASEDFRGLRDHVAMLYYGGFPQAAVALSRLVFIDGPDPHRKDDVWAAAQTCEYGALAAMEMAKPGAAETRAGRHLLVGASLCRYLGEPTTRFDVWEADLLRIDGKQKHAASTAECASRDCDASEAADDPRGTAIACRIWLLPAPRDDKKRVIEAAERCLDRLDARWMDHPHHRWARSWVREGLGRVYRARGEEEGRSDDRERFTNLWRGSVDDALAARPHHAKQIVRLQQEWQDFEELRHVASDRSRLERELQAFREQGVALRSFDLRHSPEGERRRGRQTE
jgi:hypothetical protein